jgi:hypothetical protein
MALATFALHFPYCFRHRVSSSDERRRPMTQGVRPEDHVSGGGRLPRMVETPGEPAGDLSFARHGWAAARAVEAQFP